MEEKCQENNQAMNNILKSVEIRGRIEKLINLAEEKRVHYLEELDREESIMRKAKNHPMNLIKPMENSCKAARLKYLLTVLYNDGIDGYANTDDQILEWLFESIR